MSDRDSSWWILSAEDLGGDLARLQEVVRSHNWAVFSNARQDPDAPPPVALAIAKSSDGRLMCTGLIVGLNEAYSIGDGRGGYGQPVEVTSRDLRGIPVAELIGAAVHNAPEDQEFVAREALARAKQLGTVRRSPGPKGHPDEHFQMVANLYRDALKTRPRAPVAWLTEQLAADRSTVTRWLQRARDKGYLGEATPGRAGERQGDASHE